jgi:sarcosine oxidase subunit delta
VPRCDDAVLRKVKLLSCPELGARPLSEFVYGGAVRLKPAGECTDGEWAAYVFHRDGVPARRLEWWYHRPSSSWFWIDRDTGSDAIFDVRSPTPERAHASPEGT